jgi:hypothetical protein
LGTGLLHHVDTQGGLAMQHDEKLGTMKLIMLHREGGYHEASILILIQVRGGSLPGASRYDYERSNIGNKVKNLKTHEKI